MNYLINRPSGNGNGSGCDGFMSLIGRGSGGKRIREGEHTDRVHHFPYNTGGPKGHSMNLGTTRHQTNVEEIANLEGRNNSQNLEGIVDLSGEHERSERPREQQQQEECYVSLINLAIIFKDLLFDVSK